MKVKVENIKVQNSLYGSNYFSSEQIDKIKRCIADELSKGSKWSDTLNRIVFTVGHILGKDVMMYHYDNSQDWNSSWIFVAPRYEPPPKLSKWQRFKQM